MSPATSLTNELTSDPLEAPTQSSHSHINSHGPRPWKCAADHEKRASDYTAKRLPSPQGRAAVQPRYRTRCQIVSQYAECVLTDLETPVDDATTGSCRSSRPGEGLQAAPEGRRTDGLCAVILDIRAQDEERRVKAILVTEKAREMELANWSDELLDELSGFRDTRRWSACRRGRMKSAPR